MPIANATILRDTLFFLRNFLTTNITDPVTRKANQSFVMTSYPSRPVEYPIITIKDINTTAGTLGFQDEGAIFRIILEIRIWARTTAERDRIADQIFNSMRNNQFGTGSSSVNNLFDYRVLSSINIDENDGPKSKIIQIQYIYIAEGA